MRLIRSLIIIFLLSLGAFYFLEKNDLTPKEAVYDLSHVLDEKDSKLKSKSVPKDKKSEISMKGDLFQWIGKTSNELEDSFEQPLRVDKSAYGYDWWVYTDQQNQYIQFGIEDDEIKTIYATGNDISTDPVQIGEPYDKLNDRFSFDKEITYEDENSSYTFQLSDEDLEMRPLAQISDDLFVQMYFDTLKNELSSIRVLTADTLLKQQAYKIEYRGNLPEAPELSDEAWEKVESGMKEQIFDISNVMRNQFDKSSVEMDDVVGEVAYHHSQDMAENNYFSHYSQNGDGLKERLAEKDVVYTSAGENIAAQYPDAPAAMEGWLNSKDHRKALLNDDYTQLGVGVHRFYYTQNFIEKP